jgi:hypothetical protein
MNLYRLRGFVPTADAPPATRRRPDAVDAAPGGSDGRLNLFQRMMLRWSELHPYNPVHVVRIPRPLDPERLRGCIGGRLRSAGLTGLVVDRKRWRFCYTGGPEAVDLTVASAGSDPDAMLANAIEHEFILPFASTGRVRPFRFLALDEGDVFVLALTYDHFVASGDAIARLLTGIADRYCGREPAAAPVERYPATYRNLLLRHPLWTLRALAGLPALIARSRKAHRPHYRSIEDATNAFAYFRLDPAQAAALRSAGTAWGVTLNDLLMAAVLTALAPLAAARRGDARRPELSVASILNARQDFPACAAEALSPCLAAFSVGHPVPDGIGLRELAQHVHRVSARVRHGRLYLQSIFALGVSALLWPLLSTRRRHRFYPKHYSAWAGVTTLNVSPLLGAGFDYLRAVPTGPLCPLVFAVTVARDVLHVGISFRTSAISRTAVDELADEFVRCIDQLRATNL